MVIRELIAVIEQITDEGLEQYGEQYLLGTDVLSEELYSECKEYVGERLAKGVRGNITCITKNALLVTYTLIQFAMREYEGGQFWQELYVSLGFEGDLGIPVYRGICECIERCMKKYNLYFHKSSERKMYVMTVLIHALIPQYMIDKLYDLLLDIYYKDLEEDYIEEEVSELYKYLVKVFKHYIEADDMTFNVEGKKMTIANQQLSKAFRVAWIQSPNIIFPIFKRLIRHIDEVHYAKELVYEEEDRFDKAFEKWRSKEQMDAGGLARSNRCGSGGKRKFSRAQYYLVEGELHLVVPRQIIDIDYVEHQVKLQLYTAKEVLSEYILEVSGRICFKTQEREIHLRHFESKLGYRLYGGETILYDSKDMLHREYILFNEDGEEITGKQVGEEKIRILTKQGESVETDDVDTYKEHKYNYVIHTMYLNENSYVYIGDKVLTTSVAHEVTALQQRFKDMYTCIKSKGKSYNIYTNRPQLKVRLPYSMRINDFIVGINNLNYGLEEIGIAQIKEIFDGSGDCIAVIELDDGLLPNGLPIELLIRAKGTQRILLQENFFIINGFKCMFEKELYYMEKESILVTLEGEDIVLDSELSLPYTFPISKLGRRNIPISLRGKKYDLQLVVPQLKWKLGNKESQDIGCQHIWHEDLIQAKQLILTTPSKPKLLLLISDNRASVIEGRISSNGYHYTVENELHTTQSKKITLGLSYQDKEFIITNIYYQPAIENLSIRYYMYSDILKGLQCFWTLLGKGEIWVDIIYNKTNQVVKTYSIKNGKPLSDPALELYFGMHRAVIYQLIEDEFFDEEPEKVILAEQIFVVGDKFLSKVSKKMLKIRRCLCDDDKIYEVPNFYIKHIRYDRKTQHYTAEGLFYTSTYTGSKPMFMQYYNPLFIEVLDEECLRLKIVDKYGEVLIYDKQTQRINPKEVTNQYERYLLVEEVEVIII